MTLKTITTTDHRLDMMFFWQKSDQQKSTMTMRAYNNILAMAQPLRAKSPLFIGDKNITLSWMEQPKKPAPTTTGLDFYYLIFHFPLRLCISL
jgi:hypothetical protein